VTEIFGFTQSQSTELLRMLQAYKAGQLSGGNLVTPQGNLRPDIVPFKFVESGETLLPYGIAEVYGVVTAGEPRLHVRRPTGDDAAWFWSFDCASQCDHPVIGGDLSASV
jgi:hypothetical protein